MAYEMCRNPCFAGMCFAMILKMLMTLSQKGRNPCFTGTCFAIDDDVQEGDIITLSQSLFYWNMFCNVDEYIELKKRGCVAILVLLEHVLQYEETELKAVLNGLVAILVLLEHVLQSP